MNRQHTNTLRARLTVEALETRELPSLSLTAFLASRPLASQQSPVQVRSVPPLTGGPGTCNILAGILFPVF
jgi:hypothetical protein